MFSKEELRIAVDILKKSSGCPATVVEDLEKILNEDTELDPIWLLNRNACIGTIVWYREDVENVLKENNYDITEENVNKVLKELRANSSHNYLEDCESGWDAIYNAIDDANLDSNITVMVFEKEGKEIIFDDFNDETLEYGTYWGDMCQECYEKYKNIIKNNAGDGGSGICSVMGCHNEANYYVDFNKEEVKFKRIRSDMYYKDYKIINK